MGAQFRIATVLYKARHRERRVWHGSCFIPHAPVVTSDQGRRLVLEQGPAMCTAGERRGR